MAVESLLAEVTGIIDVQCPWPEGHPRRVAGYCAHLASAAALDGSTTALIVKAALLHEIGKLGVSERVLRKADRLTQEEYEEIKRHPIFGAEMCRALPGGEMIADIVRSQHEHWNGEGYPDGRSGEAIPVGARILAIADAYDTLTMDRPWRPAYTLEESLQIMWFGADTQWDPHLVELFDRVIRSRFPKGVPVLSAAS